MFLIKFNILQSSLRYSFFFHHLPSFSSRFPRLVPRISQPSNMTGGTLMPHQIMGLSWMWARRTNGLCSILADGMGEIISES